MNKPIAILVCLLLTAPTIAQSAASPDGFAGLVLNETTLNDATNALGQPDADKTDGLDVSKIGKWLDAKHKEKIFRKLTYKNRDFSKIELSFLDGKLIMIDHSRRAMTQKKYLTYSLYISLCWVGPPACLINRANILWLSSPQRFLLITTWLEFLRRRFFLRIVFPGEPELTRNR